LAEQALQVIGNRAAPPKIVALFQGIDRDGDEISDIGTTSDGGFAARVEKKTAQGHFRYGRRDAAGTQGALSL
jgi:hypothetical protein